jgi:hypothetical protein
LKYFESVGSGGAVREVSMTEKMMDQLERHDIQYDGVHCSLSIKRISHGIVRLKISGSDVGEFGDAPLLVLDRWLAGSESVELFIDAHQVRGASIEVSGVWAVWLGKRKDKLRAVTMLTGSPFVHVTAEFVRRFADLGGIMRICTEPAVFETAFREALKSN